MYYIVILKKNLQFAYFDLADRLLEAGADANKVANRIKEVEVNLLLMNNYQYVKQLFFCFTEK